MGQEPEAAARAEIDQLLIAAGWAVQGIWPTDAWHVPGSGNTSNEVTFARYCYKPQPLLMLEEGRPDIPALEKETERMLGEILEGGGA